MTSLIPIVPKQWTGVYFIKEEDSYYVKIGKSKNVASRLASLQTANPRELLLIGLIKPRVLSLYQLELYTHRVFYSYKVRGEWYRMEGDFISFLNRMNIGQPTPDHLVKFPYRQWMDREGAYWRLQGKENPNKIDLETYLASLPY